MTDEMDMTVVFEVKNEWDAAKLAEILAMNGYKVSVKHERRYEPQQFLVQVQPKEMG